MYLSRQEVGYTWRSLYPASCVTNTIDQPMSCDMTSASPTRRRQAREELRRLDDMADSDGSFQLDPNSNLSFDITPTETGSGSGDVFT